MQKSETVGALAAALAKAQGAMAAAKKDSSNPQFRSQYADLAAIVEAIRKPLADNELSYCQIPGTTPDGLILVETILMHASGEWISGTLAMQPTMIKQGGQVVGIPPEERTPQVTGSCIQYARRYSLQSVVGIPADTDDDGNAASGNGTQPAQAQRKAAEPKPEQVSRQMKAEHDAPVAERPPVERPLSDAMPDSTPREILTWFMARLATITITPKPTPEQIAEKAKLLATTLKANGLGEKDRQDAYSWLTGEVSGKDMTPEQLALLFRNATMVGLFQRCAMAERDNRTQGDDPDAPVPLLGVVQS